MNERTKLVHRLKEGERMTDLCREFGIYRKTGHSLKRSGRWPKINFGNTSTDPPLIMVPGRPENTRFV